MLELLNSLRPLDVGDAFDVGIEIEIRCRLNCNGGVRKLEQFL